MPILSRERRRTVVPQCDGRRHCLPSALELGRRVCILLLLLRDCQLRLRIREDLAQFLVVDAATVVRIPLAAERTSVSSEPAVRRSNA